MRLKLSLAAMLLALAACSPQNSSGTAQVAAALPNHPVSGLKVVPLTVTTASKRYMFTVEIAASDAEQQKGLMFRSSMGVDEGMIFPMNPPRPAAFWMRNTVIPLDIIYIGADHRILNIAANAVPYDERPLHSAGKAAAVLELNGGRAAQLGVAAGDRVDW